METLQAVMRISHQDLLLVVPLQTLPAVLRISHQDLLRVIPLQHNTTLQVPK
jgi:hypothetical protein